jgi:hypothetical protein
VKEYDDGKNFIQETVEIALSSQKECVKLTISASTAMLGWMANALDSFPKEPQVRCRREMYKTSPAVMTPYFGAMEQACCQWAPICSEALRQSSNVLETVRSKME